MSGFLLTTLKAVVATLGQSGIDQLLKTTHGLEMAIIVWTLVKWPTLQIDVSYVLLFYHYLP
jgi:hypothetical protein